MLTATAMEYSTSDYADMQIRTIADYSRLGTLADEVLADLIRSAGEPTILRRSEAIRTAASWFSAAADVEAMVTSWKHAYVDDTLRRMLVEESAASIDKQETRSRSEVVAEIRSIANQLKAVIGGAETDELVSSLRERFDRISRATLLAASDAARAKSAPAAWLTT